MRAVSNLVCVFILSWTSWTLKINEIKIERKQSSCLDIRISYILYYGIILYTPAVVQMFLFPQTYWDL